MDSELLDRWEQKLAEHGLSLGQFEKQGIQPLIAPSRHSAIEPLDEQFQTWKDKSHGLNYEDLANVHLIPATTFRRDIPAWAGSNQAVQAVLLSFFPLLETSDYQRERAGETCLLIYKYFRLCEPSAYIAAHFKTTISNVQRRVERIRARAKELQLD